MSRDESERDVVRVKRARHVDGEAYAFTLNYLPVAIGERVNVEILRTVPLVRFLEQTLGVEIATAFETVGAASADSEIAHWLDIHILSPVMHIRRVLFAEDGRTSWFTRGRQGPMRRN